MKELPKVFVNKIDKEFNNYQERASIDEPKKINLDNILTKDKYSFNHIYLITLKDNTTIKDSIIQILDTKILTIDHSWILINDILSIKEIKK